MTTGERTTSLTAVTILVVLVVTSPVPERPGFTDGRTASALFQAVPPEFPPGTERDG